MSSFTVRSARKQDCPAIHQLVQDLAHYERMPDGPQLTLQALERDGFGEQPLFHALVAECDATQEILGCAVYVYTYATWQGRSLFIEDLYVKPQYRARGIGDALYRRVIRIAVESDCHLVTFVVLDWNLPSIEFYKARLAEDVTEKEGWHYFSMHRGHMEEILNKTP